MADERPAHHLLLTNVTATLIKKADNWKDGMAGWHKYRMTFTLKDGRVVKEEMSGTREDCMRV